MVQIYETDIHFEINWTVSLKSETGLQSHLPTLLLEPLFGCADNISGVDDAVFTGHTRNPSKNCSLCAFNAMCSGVQIRPEQSAAFQFSVSFFISSFFQYT